MCQQALGVLDYAVKVCWHVREAKNAKNTCVPEDGFQKDRKKLRTGEFSLCIELIGTSAVYHQ